MKKNRNILKTSQDQQLDLIKRKPKKCRMRKKVVTTSYSAINNFLENNYKLNRKYKILFTLYNKPKKVAYILKKRDDDIKYIIKSKSIDFLKKDHIKIYHILKNLKSEYFPTYIDFTKEHEYYYIIYKYFEGYSLKKYLEDTKTLSYEKIKIIFLKIVEGVKILHLNGIIHCDIKLENILINDDMNVKIIDFDLSRTCDNNEIMLDCLIGTIEYIAPESYDLCIYSRKTDIWALGILLYVLITKKFPISLQFSDLNHSNLCRRNEFKHINYDELIKSIKEKNFNLKLVNLIKAMLSFKDTVRCDIEYILNYNW